jgi:hypothetical protein
MFGLTAKQQSEIQHWKEVEELHARQVIANRNGLDQRMTKVGILGIAV